MGPIAQLLAEAHYFEHMRISLREKPAACAFISLIYDWYTEDRHPPSFFSSHSLNPAIAMSEVTPVRSELRRIVLRLPA